VGNFGQAKFVSTANKKAKTKVKFYKHKNMGLKDILKDSVFSVNYYGL